MCDCKKSKRQEIEELKTAIAELKKELTTHALHPYPYTYMYYPSWVGTDYPNTVIYTNGITNGES